MDDLKRLWTRADAVGFSWISVWDHFYTNPLNQRMDSYCEAVASMAVLDHSLHKTFMHPKAGDKIVIYNLARPQ